MKRIRPETYPTKPYRVGGGVLDYRMGYRALDGDTDLGLYETRPAAQLALDTGDTRSGRVACTEKLPTERVCGRCEGPVPPHLRPQGRYCSRACRKAAENARRPATPARHAQKSPGPSMPSDRREDDQEAAA
jgi:hypothetical protein